MKQVDKIFYENKTQSESLSRFKLLIDTFEVNVDEIKLFGQYIRGIPFNDEIDGSHYMISGKIVVEILCKKATIIAPEKRKSSTRKPPTDTIL